MKHPAKTLWLAAEMLIANEQLRGQNTHMVRGAVTNTHKDAKPSSALYDVTKGTSTILLPDLLVWDYSAKTSNCIITTLLVTLETNQI